MEGMRELLRGSLHESLRAMSPEDRLAAAWPVACGRTLAGRGVPTNFTKGILTVEVTDSAWRAQMQSMRVGLQHDLTRIAGVPVSAIHFELRGSPSHKGASDNDLSQTSPGFVR